VPEQVIRLVEEVVGADAHAGGETCL
jgi:hypothetical protein